VDEFQKTLSKKISFSGIALHSGEVSKINLLPAKVNQGIIFIRKDIKNSSCVKALWSNVKVANLCTMIKNEQGHTISTIEHLMFALYVLNLTNVTIEVFGSEIPILDGSSKIFIQELLKNKFSYQDIKINTLKIKNSIEIRDKEKFIKYVPTCNNFLEIDYTLNYNDHLIKKQRYIIKDICKNFEQISEARTFCHQEDLEKIFAMGLAKGGSLDNAIVISGKKILNQEGLRYKNEFVRHKILDCIGDLYLAGHHLNGKIICNQGGHELTYRLLQKIFSNKNNYYLKNQVNISPKNLKNNLKSNINYKVAV